MADSRPSDSRENLVNLKVEQQKAVENLMDGNDVLAVLPTGYGKSRIYQAFSQITDTSTGGNSLVLVVAPLMSIIQDQLSTLERLNYPGADLKNVDEKALNDCKFKILFGSAEEVLSKSFQNLLGNKDSTLHQTLSLIVVDESHTVETWSGKR